MARRRTSLKKNMVWGPYEKVCSCGRSVPCARAAARRRAWREKGRRVGWLSRVTPDSAAARAQMDGLVVCGGGKDGAGWIMSCAGCVEDGVGAERGRGRRAE